MLKKLSCSAGYHAFGRWEKSSENPGIGYRVCQKRGGEKELKRVNIIMAKSRQSQFLEAWMKNVAIIIGCV